MTRAPAPPKGPAETGPTALRRSLKGTPPARHETLGALDAAPAKKPAKLVTLKPKPAKTADKPEKKRSERTKALNFSVTANFRKAFKLAAEAENCKKVELLEKMFAEWQNRHPV